MNLYRCIIVWFCFLFGAMIFCGVLATFQILTHQPGVPIVGPPMFFGFAAFLLGLIFIASNTTKS